jgi:hypothetical protein
MLEHEVRRLGRFGKAESFKKCSEVGETSLLGCPSCPTRSSTWTNYEPQSRTRPPRAVDRALAKTMRFDAARWKRIEMHR